MPRKPNALDGLYGKASALAGAVGGQARTQEAWTPLWFLDAARTALGGRIALDPCGASAWSLPADGKRSAIEGGWFADLTLTGPGGYEGPSPHGGYVAALDGKAGSGWTGGAFVNPEYNDLLTWLEAMLAAARAGCPVVALFPVRPRRQWWVDAVRSPGAELVCLRYDVVFRGYKSAHPENMCAVTWGCRLPDLGKRETWRV